MALVIPNVGKSLALNYLVNKTSSTEQLVLKLFSNDVTPASTTINSNFVYTTTQNGYAPITLNAASWTISDGTASYPEQTWTLTGPIGNVYGYAVVTSTTNTVLMAERFSSAPYNVVSVDDRIRVTLNINLT